VNKAKEKCAKKIEELSIPLMKIIHIVDRLVLSNRVQAHQKEGLISKQKGR
jgi:hypothetical protein